MKLELNKIDGKWHLNNKPISELTPNETKFLDMLIIEAKLQTLEVKKEIKSSPDWEQLLKNE